MSQKKDFYIQVDLNGKILLRKKKPQSILKQYQLIKIIRSSRKLVVGTASNYIPQLKQFIPMEKAFVQKTVLTYLKKEIW